MKILMTTDTTAGVWTYALQLAAELHESGIEVALATMAKRRPHSSVAKPMRSVARPV